MIIIIIIIIIVKCHIFFVSFAVIRCKAFIPNLNNADKLLHLRCHVCSIFPTVFNPYVKFFTLRLVEV